ncbi:hypothetical protein [Streptomyces sp. NBC_00344]|uniref:hypothetical protein n=1 Tax=Streptomyces sp. NBC_00344 TaxID=2975720 RepID=UPI002E1C41AB
MADERCEWLDKDTADRLLRGGPVGAVDDHARAQAARLYAALDGVARPSVHPENAELPGEKAALEAFRLAGEGGADADPLGPVWLAAAPGAASAAGGLWRRPVRFGLAAVVAGCALSGVAVAAGTGVLPSPFGQDAPVPASSVSAAASPRTLISASPTGTGTSAAPGPGTGAPDDGNKEQRTGQPPSGDAQRGPDPGQRGAGSADPETGAGRDRTKTPDKNVHGTTEDVYRRLTSACRDYRAGRVDGEHRRILESQADGASKVGKFCDRILGATGEGDDAGHHFTFGPVVPTASTSSPLPGPSLPLRSSAAPRPGGKSAGNGQDGRTDQ